MMRSARSRDLPTWASSRICSPPACLACSRSGWCAACARNAARRLRPPPVRPRFSSGSACSPRNRCGAPTAVPLAATRVTEAGPASTSWCLSTMACAGSSPPVERSFELPHIVRYEGLHLEKASVTFRKQRLQDRDVYDYVVVYYSLGGPPPAPLRVAIRRSPEIERALTSAHIEFTCDTDSTVQSGATYNVIRIAPGLRCEARFDPDFEYGRVVATLRTVDRFEPVVLDFETPALDTKALDDLVNFMLAKPSGFLLRAPLRGFVR